MVGLGKKLGQIPGKCYIASGHYYPDLLTQFCSTFPILVFQIHALTSMLICLHELLSPHDAGGPCILAGSEARNLSARRQRLAYWTAGGAPQTFKRVGGFILVSLLQGLLQAIAAIGAVFKYG